MIMPWFAIACTKDIQYIVCVSVSMVKLNAGECSLHTVQQYQLIVLDF